MAQFISLFPFSNIKKGYFSIVAEFFSYSLFQILKKHTYESQSTWHTSFADCLFEVLKKNPYKS